MEKILITGAAGFIGFHLSKFYLAKKSFVFGIDNLNSYYDINLKIDRLNILKTKKNFNFKKIDLAKDIEKLKKIVEIEKFDKIFHFAAQAGVRYSFKNPQSFINSNIIGTFNLLEAFKNHFNGHMVIASTSSIYGQRDQIAFKENDKSDFQVSLYSASKKSVESIAHNYSYNHGLNISILRFFTVYGPWGRPDMALFKFVKNILEDKPIDVYNYGEMYRDFTYIDDLILSISKVAEQIPDRNKNISLDSISPNANYRIINIGNQNMISLKKFIQVLEGTIGKKAIINYKAMQPGDVKYTHSNTDLLYNLTNFRPNTLLKVGISEFYKWYRNYYK